MGNGLKGLDEIFGGSELNTRTSEDEIVQLDIENLIDYRKGNIGKYRYNEEDMNDLVESIKNNGVIQPAIVRPIENGMYEIIIGHHRRDACILAGIDTLPCIIKDMDDNTAELLFMDSNIQKGFEKLLHSEKAELIYRRNEALKAQGKRTDLMSQEERENQTSASEEFHLGITTVKRYLRIHQLVDNIKELLDNEQMAIRTAVNLSYLPREAQVTVSDILIRNKIKLSENQSVELRENAKLGSISEELIEKIILGEKDENHEKRNTKSRKGSYKIKPVIFLKYFTDTQEEKEIDNIIDEALELYFSN